MRGRSSGLSTNLSVKLLRTVGSPFSSEMESPQDGNEALELYNCAHNNKISLTYLEALKSRGSLEKFGLKSKYEEEQRKYHNLRKTVSRVAHRLNSAGIDYAVFKSIMPFVALTNDTDILHMGTRNEYEKAVNIMTQTDYIRIIEAEAVPLQMMFHDTRDGPHDIPGIKDVYDIDLYREASASHIIYLDKKRLANYVTETTILGEQVKVLSPRADLIAMITHALIPEMLYTFLVYYATLYYLRGLKSERLDEFIHIAKENSVTFAVRTHCSLTAALHQKAHGFVPDEIEEVLGKLGNNRREVGILQRSGYKTPHRYSWVAIIDTILEKAKDGTFGRSAIKQAVATMLSPNLAKRVGQNLVFRRRRETY